MNQEEISDYPTELVKDRDSPIYFDYFAKALKWFIGNFLFGVIPLLLMLIIQNLSKGKAGVDEIEHLSHDGVIQFLCVAIMGAVITEYFLSGFKTAGIGLFAIYGKESMKQLRESRHFHKHSNHSL